jgi:hypothetical protein
MQLVPLRHGALGSIDAAIALNRAIRESEHEPVVECFLAKAAFLKHAGWGSARWNQVDP